METLTDEEISALHEALDDEYRSWATYNQVILDFGEVRPFINIRAAEARHTEALLTLFARYGLRVPENTWVGRVDRYESLQDACEASAEAERENSEMYERLLKMTQRSDILTVLRNLQAASQERHLPAFQRCSQRDANSGGGSGRGHGHRRRHCQEGQD